MTDKKQIVYSDNYSRFVKGYYGQTIINKYGLDHVGYWEILGEDSNCDLGGYHNMPLLGIVEGKLVDVIEYAMDLKGFWAWGSGGEIKKWEMPNIVKIDSNHSARKKAHMEKIVKLQKELEEAVKSAKTEGVLI